MSDIILVIVNNKPTETIQQKSWTNNSIIHDVTKPINVPDSHFVTLCMIKWNGTILFYQHLSAADSGWHLMNCNICLSTLFFINFLCYKWKCQLNILLLSLIHILIYTFFVGSSSLMWLSLIHISPHLHGDFNFTELVLETAGKSLRHSCRSELTRQGISLPLDRYSYGRRLHGVSSKRY